MQNKYPDSKRLTCSKVRDWPLIFCTTIFSFNSATISTTTTTINFYYAKSSSLINEQTKQATPCLSYQTSKQHYLGAMTLMRLAF
ncbi:hypothetical protein DOY81_002014 [Sarcophaga bullata]|nr:hypothetical protein DOY81_002014 [Sarcophaga bullata]